MDEFYKNVSICSAVILFVVLCFVFLYFSYPEAFSLDPHDSSSCTCNVCDCER